MSMERCIVQNKRDKHQSLSLFAHGLFKPFKVFIMNITVRNYDNRIIHVIAFKKICSQIVETVHNVYTIIHAIFTCFFRGSIAKACRQPCGHVNVVNSIFLLKFGTITQPMSIIVKADRLRTVYYYQYMLIA